MVGLFTNQQGVGAPALHFLPWCIALPVMSVWAFQGEGDFVGATRDRELRVSMLRSFAVFLVLAIVLERIIGYNGLWCALACFMVVRGIRLGLRLSRLERIFAQPAPVS